MKSRVIKFRAKALSDNAWVYGDLVNYFSPGREKVCIREWSGLEHDVVEETVCQYAETNDINEVEIYDGDIVEFVSGRKARVAFQSGSWMCLLEKSIGNCDFILLNSPFANTCRVKVIGNIFDNTL